MKEKVKIEGIIVNSINTLKENFELNLISKIIVLSIEKPQELKNKLQ
jgi:hypothetical protein